MIFSKLLLTSTMFRLEEPTANTLRQMTTFTIFLTKED